MTDTAKASWITDHPYRPRDQWWSLCGHPGCRMAEAAHAETTSNSLSVNSDQEQPDGHTPAGP